MEVAKGKYSLKFSFSIRISPGKFPKEDRKGILDPNRKIRPSIRKQTPIQRKVLPIGSIVDPRKGNCGGEGGIRTPGRCYPTLAFQASTINRSDTSPVLVAITMFFEIHLRSRRFGQKSPDVLGLFFRYKLGRSLRESHDRVTWVHGNRCGKNAGVAHI